MEVYGGSFVKALRECFAHADFMNFARLEQAFPEIVKQYTEMGEILRKREELP